MHAPSVSRSRTAAGPSSTASVRPANARRGTRVTGVLDALSLLAVGGVTRCSVLGVRSAAGLGVGRLRLALGGVAAGIASLEPPPPPLRPKEGEGVAAAPALATLPLAACSFARLAASLRAATLRYTTALRASCSCLSFSATSARLRSAKLASAARCAARCASCWGVRTSGGVATAAADGALGAFMLWRHGLS